MPKPISPQQQGITPSDGFIGGTYERFLRMPVPVVLTVLWVAGMVLVSSCVLITLYVLATALA